MVSKALVFDHVSTHFPLVALGDFGEGLGRGQWDRYTELNGLSEMLEELNSDTELAIEDFDRLDATEGQISLPDNMPLTIDAIRRGVLYRNLPDDAEVDPLIEAALEDEDGKPEALGAGFLLTAFINGLDRGGYPKKESKSVLREQFEYVLEALCDNTISYGAIGVMHHTYRIMKYCELHTPETRMKQIMRGANITRNFGFELIDF